MVTQGPGGERRDSDLVRPESPAKDSSGDVKLTLLSEELAVGKEEFETGRLRVDTHTRVREAVVDENLVSESADIVTVPIGRQISEAPLVRQEGDTTIIPIVEEVLHTERRLILKEEIRITRRQTSQRFQDRVPLRYQEAVVTRVQSATDRTDAMSGKNDRSADVKE